MKAASKCICIHFEAALFVQSLPGFRLAAERLCALQKYLSSDNSGFYRRDENGPARRIPVALQTIFPPQKTTRILGLEQFIQQDVIAHLFPIRFYMQPFKQKRRGDACVLLAGVDAG